MSRKLVVFDSNAGTFVAVDPQAASGVEVPAFTYGTTRPPVGNTKGQAFISTVTGIASVWDGATWTDIAKPDVAFYPDEATLLADSPPAKTVALAEDTGNMFTRVGTAWLSMGLRVYPSEAGMLGTNPPDGTVGYAADSGAFAVRTGGVWAALTNQGVFIGAQAPANSMAGQQWYEAASRTLWTYDGTNWQPPSGGMPVGTIIQHVSVTPPPGFLLCDGSAIPGATGYDALRNLIGNNTPNLVDQFIRGADTQNQIDGFTKHQDTTRRPRNDFTVRANGTTTNGGGHHHTFNSHMYNTDGGWSSSNPEIWTNTIGSRWSHRTDGEEGIHNHNVTVNGTVNGGGDTETAPAHVRLAYHVKAF